MIASVRLIVAWVTLFIIGTDLFVVSPLIPLIADDFHVAARGAGLTVTTFSLGYVFAAPVFGHIADRIGRRRVLTCCLIAFSAANLLTAGATHLPIMMAARLLCGISAAGVTPSIYALVGSTAPTGRRGTWIAIVLTGLLSSLPLGAPLGAIASLTMGWPVVFLILAAGSLTLAPLHHFLWPATRVATAAGAQPDGFSPLVLARRLIPTVAWASALYAIYTYLAAGLANLGYSHADIDETVFVYGIAAFVGALLGGRLADRLGQPIAIRVSLLGVSLCYLVLQMAILHGNLVSAAFAVTSVFAQIFFPAQQSLLLSEFPNRNATALAWNNSALFLGMALGSLIGGQAMTLGGFSAIMPISTVLAILGWAAFDYARATAKKIRII